MRVWLAEKPSFARDLAKALGNPVKEPTMRNTWNTNGGRVVAAVGHLVELAEPQDYNPDWKEWDSNKLPIYPENFDFSYRPIAQKEDVLQSMKRAFAGATEIIIATDAGREGEYIAWTILNYLRLDHIPKRRLWSSGANVDAIQKAAAKLKDFEEKALLADAARLRAESDWVEGLNLTRLFTDRYRPDGHKGVISIGRVQTAALAIIVRRQREIDTFVSKRYYDFGVNVTVGEHSVYLKHSPPEDQRITDVVQARQIAQTVNRKPTTMEVATTHNKQRPPQLFESSSLQIRAYNLWGWAATKTETIAQSLYDTHKLISYPRTDGVHLETDQWKDVPTILRHLKNLTGVTDVDLKKGEKFADLVKLIPDQPIQRDEVFNTDLLNKSGADHHGIIPTTEGADLSALTDDERKLYLLVVRQFLAQLLPDCEYDQKRISWNANGRVFSTTGRTITEAGWTTLFGKTDTEADNAERDGEDEEIDPNLPPIKNGDTGFVSQADIIERHTIAPPNFSEATLIGAMRDLTRVVKDPSDLAKVKVARMIGTKSTWPETIRKLRDRQYITGKGKITPTNLGIDLIDLCEKHVPDLVNVTSTAILELILLEVEDGKRTYELARAAIQRRNIDAINKFKGVSGVKLRPPGIGGAKNNPSAKQQNRPFQDFPEGSYALDVPYDDKDDAKALGAKFNSETRKWHISKKHDRSDLERRGWLKA